MEPSLGWVHTAPRSVRIAYLQGFFESAGEIDVPTMSLRATVLPWLARDIVQLLRGLDVEPAVIDFDPPTIAVDLRKVARIPLLSPVVKNGKYYEVASLSSGRR